MSKYIDLTGLSRFLYKCKQIFADKSELNSKQDTLESGQNIKTVNNTSLLGSGNVSITPYEEISWAALKAKRDGSTLVPGKWYRITDYNCTTVQENTQSADHQFDILVLATDTNKLSEEARAIKHAGDTYFTNAQANLDGWKIWYCLDNDTDRFVWAKDLLSPGSEEKVIRVRDGSSTFIYVRYPNQDNPGQCAWCYDMRGDGMSIKEYVNYNSEDVDTTEIIYTDTEYPCIGDDTLDMGGTYVTLIETSWGTGVIHRMIDEWNNECPYDFKNIKFKRKLTDGEYDPDEGVDTWVYTFTWVNQDDQVKDLSIIGNTLQNDEGQYSGIHDNVIKSVSAYDIISPESPTEFGIALNDIVFISSYSYDGGFFYGCIYNTFGHDCYSNTFGNSCTYNTFGNYCASNTFGGDCFCNTFGNNCVFNIFLTSCGSNTFGNECSYNILGNNCYSNIFFNGCYRNTFGNDCQQNTFLNGCNYNTFGNYCTSNTFGSECTSNIFGSYCNYNTFGEYVQDFITGNTPSASSTQITDYIRYLIVENGVQHVNAYCSSAASSSNPCQNIKIGLGVHGTSSSNRLRINITSQIGATESVTYQTANSQIINI